MPTMTNEQLDKIQAFWDKWLADIKALYASLPDNMHSSLDLMDADFRYQQVCGTIKQRRQLYLDSLNAQSEIPTNTYTVTVRPDVKEMLIAEYGLTEDDFFSSTP